MELDEQMIRDALSRITWQELEEEPRPPFPVEHLPQRCAEYVEAVARSLPVPCDCPAGAVLGIANAALVGRVSVRVKNDYEEGLQSYIVIVAPSGTQKTAVMAKPRKPLDEVLYMENDAIARRNREKENRRRFLGEDLKRAKGLEQKMQIQRDIDSIVDEPEFERILGDVTPEALAERMKRQNGRGIVYADEGGIVNVLTGALYGGSSGIANLDVFLQGYDNKPVVIDRKKSDLIEIRRASLSLTVALQPNMLERLTSDAELCERGLAPRFLFFVPPPIGPHNVIGLPDVPDECTAWLESTVKQLARLYRDQDGPHIIPLEDAAIGVFDNYRQELVDRSFSDLGGNDAIKAWAGKAHGKAVRLAGLLALIDNPGGVDSIDEFYLREAISLLDEYFIPHAKFAFGGKTERSNAEQRILDVVRSLEYFREAEIRHKLSGQKQFKGKKGAELFKSSLRSLNFAGYIQKLPLPNEERTQGRPPSTIYAVNPALRTQTAQIPEDDDIPF